MQDGLPFVQAGQTVGLLGGSFDPAHEGHAHITREALKRFRLDQVWWLVSPGNPLKERGPAPIRQRMAAARNVMQHPRVFITDFEVRVGTQYTAETLAELKARRPAVRFTWLMGADNLAQFHLWQDWTWIMENVPVGVLARPGDRIAARTSPAASRYDRFRLRGRASALLARSDPPAWCFINLPMNAMSSTRIRESGKW
ncbi:MAG TPA: nicotinate-nucleotide adenylyltransferase [Rhodobacteraceae bacterium]|nr:nicotinate-nucleotide adenylyltransferase [Paracoccaceae bacterium]